MKKQNKKRAERKNPDIRKEEILKSAMDLAEKIGYINLNTSNVGTDLKLSYPSVLRYFKSMQNLRREVLKRAVKENRLSIIAQILANKDTLSKKITTEIKKQAAGYLAK